MGQKDWEGADELLRRSRYPEAIERFRSLLSLDPENAELRARCGEAYRLAGNAERAFHHYNKGAAIYARLGEHPKALQLLAIANTLSPNEPDILFRMAEAKKVLNDLRDFEPILRQLVQVARGAGDRRRLWALDELCQRHPEDIELSCRRAEALAEAGRIDESINAWKQVSAKADQRGIDFVPMLQRAAQIAPERADVGIDLASVLLANRRPREALVLLLPYYEKFPDDVGILEALLRALESLGASDRIVPARIELVKARAKRGQRDAGMKEIALLLHAAPEDIAALEVSAHAYTAFGEMGEAIAIWRRLAHQYDRLGRKFERDRAILMLLKTNPDDEEALLLGARALREAGRTGEADVLDNRLALVRSTRSRNIIPQRPPERSSASQPDRRAPPREPTLPSQTTAPNFFDGEEPTMPPESLLPDEVSLLAPSEPSEPSVEPMPIAKSPWFEPSPAPAPNPFTEGLELTPSRRRTPSLVADAQKATQTFLPLDQINAPTAPYARESLDDMPLSGPSEPAIASEPIEEIDEREHTPTRPLEAAPTPRFGVRFDSGIEVPIEPIPIEDAQIESEIMANDLALLELPIELPGGAEETTSKMMALVNDELNELRAQLSDAAGKRPPSSSAARSEPPRRTGRPTLRQKLRADLLDQGGKAKKL